MKISEKLLKITTNQNLLHNSGSLERRYQRRSMNEFRNNNGNSHEIVSPMSSLPKMIEIEDQMEQKEQNLNNNHNNHYDEYCSSPSIIIERNETEISSPGITSHIALPTAHILQGTPHSTKYQYQTLEQNRLPIFDGRASLKREKSSNSQNHQENLQMNMNHQVVGLSTERRKSIEFESFEPFRDRLIDVVGDVVSNGIVDGGEAEDEIFVF